MEVQKWNCKENSKSKQVKLSTLENTPQWCSYGSAFDCQGSLLSIAKDHFWFLGV